MQPSETSLQRRLELEGTYNVRDLGGYATRDGGHTRWHTLLRADKLNRVTPAGQHTLIDYGVRAIIDLRYSPEVQSEPDVFATSTALRYLHMPLYELSGDGELPVVPNGLEDLYRLILDHRQSQIQAIFNTLVSPGMLPALVHCTAGKDRTGVIVALALGAAGVPDETIVEDYVLSSRYLHTLLDELRALARDNGFDTEWYESLLTCVPETMERTLEHLNQAYGGIPAYLLKAGISEKQLAQLRDALVE
jgi:protein-tyrosine phosphatase